MTIFKPGSGPSLFMKLGFGVAMLCLIALSADWAHRGNASELLRTGATTSATITNLQSTTGWASSRNPAGRSSTDIVSVRFTDEKGARRDAAISEYVGADEYLDLHIGDSIPIVYRRATPSDAFLKDSLVRVSGIGAKMIAMFVVMLASLALGVHGVLLQRRS